jgi:glycosyltransferase involved in cell wall biosynthesis
MSKQKIIVSVTNDLATDQRADKICTTLMELNYEVILVGRLYKDSKIISRNYETKRFKLWFNKGLLFYANYNIRLFVFLMFTKPAILWSNDLDTLPSNFLVSKLYKIKLIFDSHEYFTEVPELINRPFIQSCWKTLEKGMLPKMKNVITVSQSIAALFEKEYHINVSLLRNVPILNKKEVHVANIKIESKKIILYQGAINVNRGIEHMVKAMQYVDTSILYLLGDGDISQQISALIIELQLQKKVIMLGKIPFEELHGYTQQADIGLSLEEDAGLNYRFALPNKLFDYVHAGIPVLVSNLPEMKNLVRNYELGDWIENHDAKHIAQKITAMLENKEKMELWKANCKKAALELNWDKEKQVISSLLD